MKEAILIPMLEACIEKYPRDPDSRDRLRVIYEPENKRYRIEYSSGHAQTRTWKLVCYVDL